jgi:antitoxin ParD1/3/4
MITYYFNLGKNVPKLHVSSSKIDNVCIDVMIVFNRYIDWTRKYLKSFSNPSTIFYAGRCNMHISLTPELEAGIRQKVASGYYNNASEVIRDALRFWESNEELVQHMKLEVLQKRLVIGAGQAEQEKFVDQSVSDIITEVKNA